MKDHEVRMKRMKVTRRLVVGTNLMITMKGRVIHEVPEPKRRPCLARNRVSSPLEVM